MLKAKAEESDKTKWILCDYDIPLAKGTEEEMRKERDKYKKMTEKTYMELFITSWGEFKRLASGNSYVPSREITFAELKLASQE